METFEGIYLDLSKQSGRCRFNEAGLGWKPSGDGGTFTLVKDDIGQAQWSRAAKGYEVKVLSRTSGVIQLDGFQQEDFDRVAKSFKSWYGVNLENKEHSLRGWNWGKADFGKAELTFNVGARPAFEIPFSEIINTNLAGRNEVAVDFSLPADGEDTGTNGHLGGARARGKKSGGARDQLVEARFYIPGTVTVEKKDDGEAGSDVEDTEEQNAANIWYETLVDKAEIGDVAGDTYASFLDLLHLTPRGRFDLDMYEKSFRLRGKTYDYKIQYDSIKKFFLLPKPDDLHELITIGLDPPLRQGQTRYPFVVMQFKRDDDIELDLNISEEELAEKYKGKVNDHYSGPIHLVLTQLFRGLAGKKIIQPSKEFESRHQQSGVKCSIKANEGLLYCLDKSFIFVPKPATYIAMDHVQQITMSRVGGAVSASRTFDITIKLKGGAGEHQFSNINREEQEPLQRFFDAKNLKVRNEMADDASAIAAAILQSEDLGSSDDESAANSVINAHRGSADEDSEEADEDFRAESDSDVAEEYDSNAASSESGDGSGDEDDDDAKGGEDDDDLDDLDDDDGDVEMADADGGAKAKAKAKAKPTPAPKAGKADPPAKAKSKDKVNGDVAERPRKKAKREE